MAVHVNPGITCGWPKVLLARASFNGHFELLTAAWERLLGYGRQEFTAKTLGELMKPDRAAATVAAILDQQNMEPVDLTVRCRNGKRKSLRVTVGSTSTPTGCSSWPRKRRNQRCTRKRP